MSLPAPLNNSDLFIGLIMFIVASILLFTNKIPLSVWTSIVGVLLGYYFGYKQGVSVSRGG